jgi:hypothetical protein
VPGHPPEPIARHQVPQHGRTFRELSVGDVAAVGEVPLAVARLGWTLVSGGLNEARTDEHGTHPLPAVGPA